MDPAVKALVQFPDVLKTMSDKLDWTQKLGEALLAQQDDVMDEIQLLGRRPIKPATEEQQAAEGFQGRSDIVIVPANPEVVYVPVYKPSVVYGPWWYPITAAHWPPYYGNFSSGLLLGRRHRDCQLALGLGPL